MKQLLRDVRRHRIGTLFFVAVWLGFWTWVVIGARLGGDMDVAAIMVHPALPLLAGFLLGRWRWRADDPDAAFITALIIGTVVCLLDSALLLAPLGYDALLGRLGAGVPVGQIVKFVVAGALSTGWMGLFVGQFLGSLSARVGQGRHSQAAG